MTSKPLRLLFVIKHLEGRGGGAERVLTLIASELANRGYDVTIATFDPAGAKDFYQIDARVRRERLGIGDALAKSGFADLVRQVAALRSVLRPRRPDVAIGFMHSSYVPLGLAAIGSSVPLIASEHTAYDHYLLFGFQGAVVHAMAPLFAAFTATSERVRSGFPRSIARRMTVIPNPVVFPDARPREARSGGHVLLSVGALREEKGHDILVEAFARIAPRFPDWSLRIVGDGPRRGELERQGSEVAAAGRLVFTGSVADVAPHYAGADLFVIPSSYESFGLATAEALAAGVPAVGFANCPGTNEIIQDGINGLLVAGADRVEALAGGLATLMADGGLRARLGQAGPHSVARYSLDAVVSRWEELLARFGHRKVGRQ